MENVKTLTKLDFKTLKYCNLFLMKFQRKTKLWLIVTVVLALGIVVYDLIVMKGYFLSVLGVIFALYSVYQFLTLEKKLDQQLIQFFNGRNVNTQTVEINEETITVVRSVDSENPVVYDWSYVTQIFEMPQYFMLMVGKGSPIIVDRSPDALLEGTNELLDSIVLEKTNSKPYKKTDEDIVKVPITYEHQYYPPVEAVEVDSHSEESQGESGESIDVELVENLESESTVLDGIPDEDAILAEFADEEEK